MNKPPDRASRKAKRPSSARHTLEREEENGPLGRTPTTSKGASNIYITAKIYMGNAETTTVGAAHNGPRLVGESLEDLGTKSRAGPFRRPDWAPAFSWRCEAPGTGNSSPAPSRPRAGKPVARRHRPPRHQGTGHASLCLPPIRSEGGTLRRRPMIPSGSREGAACKCSWAATHIHSTIVIAEWTPEPLSPLLLTSCPVTEPDDAVIHLLRPAMYVLAAMAELTLMSSSPSLPASCPATEPVEAMVHRCLPSEMHSTKMELVSAFFA